MFLHSVFWNGPQPPRLSEKWKQDRMIHILKENVYINNESSIKRLNEFGLPEGLATWEMKRAVHFWRTPKIFQLLRWKQQKIWAMWVKLVANYFNFIKLYWMQFNTKQFTTTFIQTLAFTLIEIFTYAVVLYRIGLQNL